MACREQEYKQRGQGITALTPLSLTQHHDGVYVPIWTRSDEIAFDHGASLLVADGVVAAGVVAARVARSRRSLADWLVARHRVRGAHVD